jgi:hypothetical protein
MIARLGYDAGGVTAIVFVASGTLLLRAAIRAFRAPVLA